jgi:hypothetical protein
MREVGGRVAREFGLDKIQKTLNSQGQLRVAVIHGMNRLTIAAVELTQHHL